MTARAVRGTKDLFGKELRMHQRIVATARKVLEAAGALELVTPIFEETQVFEKGVGAATDIVRKEMFTFQDRGGRSLTLRPEGTAAMVRAYLEHGMKVWPQPVRLWMAGPMFRAERPQKGRYRQFHQVNYEALGSENPILDAEAVVLLYECLKELGLRRLKVKLSSVGDPEDRARYNAYLREVLSPHREALSEDSKERLELNPMRILDSKSERDQALLKELGVRPMLDFLGEEARAHLKEVERHLERLSVPYELEPALVRGLDYYGRTVFEWVTDRLGSQGAVCAGGRYDGLVSHLGGESTPAIGFAIGLERLVELYSLAGLPAPHRTPDVYVVAVGDGATRLAFRVAENLRNATPAFRVETHCGGGGFKAQMKRADRSGAAVAVILGEDEVATGTAVVKPLRAEVEQQKIAVADLAQAIRPHV